MGEGGLTGDGCGGASPTEPGAGSGSETSHGTLRGKPGQAGQAGESSSGQGWGLAGVIRCGIRLVAKPLGLIDLRVDRRRGGFLLRGEGATVGEEVLHGRDHGEALDLTGNAAAGHFGAEVGEFPEAV